MSILICLLVGFFLQISYCGLKALKGKSHWSLMVGKAGGKAKALCILLGNFSDPYYHMQKSMHIFISIYLIVPVKSDKHFPNLFSWRCLPKGHMDQVWANGEGRHPCPPEWSYFSRENSSCSKKKFSWTNYTKMTLNPIFLSPSHTRCFGCRTIAYPATVPAATCG